MPSQRKRKRKSAEAKSTTHYGIQSQLFEKLKSSRFRSLNENLFYATKSTDSAQRISRKGSLFQEYHEGFRLQVKKMANKSCRSDYKMD